LNHIQYTKYKHRLFWYWKRNRCRFLLHGFPENQGY
jgi:hypothetical protein